MQQPAMQLKSPSSCELSSMHHLSKRADCATAQLLVAYREVGSIVEVESCRVHVYIVAECVSCCVVGRVSIE